MSGRHNENEMHEFIDECFLQVLAQLVNKERPMSHRMAAMYLLYSLYVKQPFDESHRHRFEFKIRITLDQLLEIRVFINECKVNNYLDVVYIWYKLLAIKAIHFVYYRYEGIGPSNTRSVHYWMFRNIISSTDGLINDLQKSVEPRIKDLQSCHDLYLDYKTKQFDQNTEDEEMRNKNPNIIGHDLFKDSVINLGKLINDFRYNNRDFRGRGRPSVWAALRTDGSNETQIENNVTFEERKEIVKKKALNSKKHVEISARTEDVLWTEDVKEKFKREKERILNKQKSQKKRNKKNE